MLFRAEASVRYHRRRAAFLEQLDLFLTVALLACGGGTFITVLADLGHYAAAAGLIVTAVALVQLVYKPEACATRHRQWLKRWSDILAEVRASDDPPAEVVAGWEKRRQAIEVECVLELAALKADCFNKTARALGRDIEPYRFGRLQRALIQVRSFDGAVEKDSERIRLSELEKARLEKESRKVVIETEAAE
jgi:hypothetical protein